MSKKNNSLYQKPENGFLNEIPDIVINDKLGDFKEEPVVEDSLEKKEADFAKAFVPKDRDESEKVGEINSPLDSGKAQFFQSNENSLAYGNVGILPKETDARDAEADIQEKRKALKDERTRLRENAKQRLIESIKNEQERDKAVVLKQKYTLQMPMQGRSDITITNTFKQGQRVSDPHLINLLVEDGAPIEFE